MKLVIIVPAYNEAQVIFKVLKDLPIKIPGIFQIEKIVINDGSTDGTLKEARKAKVKILNHIFNRGLGAAIKTGLDYAKQINADIAVTFDSDGQHNPKDINKIIKPIILNQADLVIGSRFKKRQKVPIDRFILNWFANLTTFILFGISSTDTQSGLRAFSKKAIDKINYRADKMEFSSEIFLEAKRHNLKIIEVPIQAIYTDYSRFKGQKNTNSIFVFSKFLVRLLR